MEAEKERKLYFTSHGFRSQDILIAPELNDHSSKRKPLINAEDKTLDENISGLDEGTRTRNRLYQARIDDIWQQTVVWEAKLRTEEKESTETIMSMKDSYDVFISDFRKKLFGEVDSIFNKVHEEIIPSEISRIDVIDATVATFVKSTVPDAIERQSGEVSRQLRRAYETFDIEKKKELKRESKLVEKASYHLQHTAQRFDDECALMSSCFFNLEDDIVEQERRASRLHLLRNLKALLSLQEGNRVSALEMNDRELEDKEVLDTVIETQHLLQQMVLLHFGTKEVDFGAELDQHVVQAQQRGEFPLLDKRVSRINRKKKTKQKTTMSQSTSKLPT